MTDHEFKAPERTITAPDETTARLGEIRERVAAATEGPWEHGDRQFTAGVNERFGTDACAHCRRHGDPTWIGVRDINGQKMLTHVHTDAEPWWKHGIFAFRDSGSSVVVHDTEYGYMDQADAEFIAHAREDVPWLLAEVERLTAERDRARGLAARLEAQIARVEALAKDWRYKGEFGWGPWQEGYGPDLEGAVLDDAAARLRAALTEAGGQVHRSGVMASNPIASVITGIPSTPSTCGKSCSWARP